MLGWLYPTLDEEQCSCLGEPSRTQFIVSCGLMGWILLCYIPQWARLMACKSTEGISVSYMLLGSLSGVCAVGNIIMLPSSAEQIGCCRDNARLSCISHLLGVFQVVFSIGCFWIMLCMYAYYNKEEAQVDFSNPTVRRISLAKWALPISNSFALLIFMISAIILHHFPQYSQSWANILGTSLVVGACIQWLPQVVTTWNLGHLGSLSHTSLCFLAPYNWVFGVSMINRLGPGGWSAWIVYVLVGTMQVTLIGFAAGFWLRDYRQEREITTFEVLVGTEPDLLDGEEKDSPTEHLKKAAKSETTPLLRYDI